MRALACITTFLLAGLIAYGVGSARNQPASVPVTTPGLAPAMAAVLSQKTAPLPSAAETAIDRVRLSEPERAFADKLGTDDLGRKLHRVLVATRHSEEVPEAAVVQQAFLNELTQNPASGFELLREALRRIPGKGHPLERASLLGATLALKGKEAEVRDLALQELTANPPEARPDPNAAKSEAELNKALSTTWDMALALTAFKVYLSTTPEPTTALTGTVQSLVAQQDRGIRVQIVREFVARHPALKADLQTALHTKGIKLDVEAIAQPSAEEEQETTS